MTVVTLGHCGTPKKITFQEASQSRAWTALAGGSPSQSAPPDAGPWHPPPTRWLWRPASPSADVMSGPGWQESWPGGATSVTSFLLVLSSFIHTLSPHHTPLYSHFSFLFRKSSLSPLITVVLICFLKRYFLQTRLGAPLFPPLSPDLYWPRPPLWVLTAAYVIIDVWTSLQLSAARLTGCSDKEVRPEWSAWSQIKTSVLFVSSRRRESSPEPCREGVLLIRSGEIIKSSLGP